MGGNDKKRKKGYYQKCAQGGKRGRYQPTLAVGMRGFLITCSNRAEKDATRDAYKILNEYADELYGPEFKEQEEDQFSESEEDIEKALQKEVKGIKAKKDTPRRFLAVEAGANGCIFIKTSLEKPEELLYRIVTDLRETQVSKSRFIMKMFPVIATCRADQEKIKSTAKECLSEVFKDLKMFSYEIMIKVRNSTGWSRTTILGLFNDVFTELTLPGKVKFGAADYVISVDILKSVCCISVMKEFNALKKYNLHEITVGEKSDLPNGPKSVLKGSNDKESNKLQRRSSEDMVTMPPTNDMGCKDVKEEVKSAVPDPFMSKIAGLIQTKMTEAASVKSGGNKDLKASEGLMTKSAVALEEKEEKKPEVLSLSCPYVASSI